MKPHTDPLVDSGYLSGFALSQLYTRSRGSRVIDTAILILLISLILLAPLPFGSVQPRPVYLIEAAALACLVFWILKLVVFADSAELRLFESAYKNEQEMRDKAPFFVRNPLPAKIFRFLSFGRFPRKYEATHLIEGGVGSFLSRPNYFSFFGYPVRNTNMEIPGLIFLLLVFLQLLPLPAFLVAFISPSAAHLYKTATVSSAASWLMPISVDTFVTLSKFCEYSAYFILFVVSVNISTRRAHFWLLCFALILSVTFQSFYGLYEALAGKGEIFGYQKLNHVHIASGTFINSNHYASYVALILSLILSLAAKILMEIRLSGNNLFAALGRLFQVRGSQLLLLFGLIVLCMGAIIFARSRASLLIAVFSCVAFLFLLWSANREIPGKLFWLAAMVGTIFIAVFFGIAPLIKKFGDLPADITSETGRSQVWFDTFRMFLHFPLTGSGAGTYPQTFPIYQTVYHSSYSHAHNDLLEVAAETGIGFLLLTSLVAARIVMRMKSLMRRRLDGLAVLQAGAGCSFVAGLLTSLVHFSFQIPAICLTAVILAALFFVNLEKKLPGGKKPVT